jgi:hypothetical protein
MVIIGTRPLQTSIHERTLVWPDHGEMEPNPIQKPPSIRGGVISLPSAQKNNPAEARLKFV